MTCRPLFAFMLAITLVAGGCVTLPLPPVQTGDTEPGDWGSIKVMITYVPNVGELISDFKEWRKPTQ
jgi:hypothetical protein